MPGKELKLARRAEGVIRQRAYSCEEVASLQLQVEQLRRDAQATSSQLEAFARNNDALGAYLEESSLDDWIAILSRNMLLATIRILKAAGGVLYLKEDSPVPRKRMIAAVEDDQIVDILTDARFRALKKSEVIDGPTKIVWSRLADLDGYWLTNVDDPVLPPKIAQWHRKLGHRWLAHFALHHESALRGFLVVAYQEGQVIEPASVHVGVILALQISISLGRVKLVRRVQESAISEARSQFFRELEDPLVQGFAGIALQLGAASRALGTASPVTQTHIDTALELARESLALARRSARERTNPDRESGDLIGCLRAYIKAAQRVTGAAIEANLHPISENLSQASRRELLRIAQEAIHNVIRHAAAKTIRVGLVELPIGAIRLSVADDGVGFDFGCNRTGSGIDCIRQWASSLQADLTFITEPGLGTQLIVVLPIVDNESRRP